MAGFVSALLNVLWPVEKPKPPDLIQFEESRKRLHGIMKSVAKEADAFGSMVKQMQAPPERSPCKKSATMQKKQPKKRGARGAQSTFP